MKQPVARSSLVERLQQEIFSLQGMKAPTEGHHKRFGLGPIEAAFPNGIFPTGAVHEFLSTEQEHAAATSGFMAGLLGKLMHNKGICLWISARRTVFPPALKMFGVEPDRIIFIDLNRERDLLWCVEEALKCDALAAVVGEMREMSLTESRRLQLAVEQSKVTGLLHRVNPKNTNSLACAARWQVRPIPSELEEGMPGVGFPRWQVELLKVRNGEPGQWEMEWCAGKFREVAAEEVWTDQRWLRVG